MYRYSIYGVDIYVYIFIHVTQSTNTSLNQLYNIYIALVSLLNCMVAQLTTLVKERRAISMGWEREKRAGGLVKRSACQSATYLLALTIGL